MIDAFAPMPEQERSAFAAHYMSYLRERDGVPCLRTRTFSRREPLYQKLRSGKVARGETCWVDPVVFARNLARCEPEAGLDDRMLWALAVAKGNRAERFGVEAKLSWRGFEAAGVDDVLTYVEIQEIYHTRLLLHVLSLVGLSCEVGPPVGAITRGGIRIFAWAPRQVIEVLALAFEVVGIVAFQALREEARRLFAEHPHIRQIDALFGQLLVDEVGHVQLLRSRLGPRRMAMARAALGFAKKSLFDDNHEIAMILARRGELADLEKLDVASVVAGEPDRLPVLAA